MKELISFSGSYTRPGEARRFDYDVIVTRNDVRLAWEARIRTEGMPDEPAVNGLVTNAAGRDEQAIESSVRGIVEAFIRERRFPA
jgi:hypothetical protein